MTGRRRRFEKDDGVKLNEESVLGWDGGGAYTRRRSPGPDGLRHQSRSRSPRRSHGRSYRSKSKSGSRSRSPAQWDSVSLCRDFAAGRCEKGDRCRFAHYSRPNHDNSRRHFESRKGDGWESRRENDRASRHHSETYSSGGRSSKYHNQRYAFDEFDQSKSYRGGDNGNNVHISSEPLCKFFVAGYCRNGKHCKYSHQREGPFDSERRWADGRKSEHNLKGANEVWNDANLRIVPEESDSREPRKSKAGEWSNDELLNHQLDDPTYMRCAASNGIEKMSSHEQQSLQLGVVGQRSDSVPNIPGYNFQPNPSFPEDFIPGASTNGISHVRSNMSANYPCGQGITESQSTFPLPFSGVENTPMAHRFLLLDPKSPATVKSQATFPSHNQNEDRNPADDSYGSKPGVSKAAISVINEQLVQYSHLSATLAQLLEKRQQLPHLDAAIAQAPAQPIEASEPSKQTDPNPISDSVETKVTTSAAAEMATSDPKIVPIGDALRHSDRHLDDMAPDSGADDTKKAKEAKGIRAFKFALSEFVKGLLKPTWKEGRMNKEVYKTIVKKVVDKVFETIQPPHVPKTKEKIEQYLSLSQPKLSKLLQAYLEKYHKT